MEHWKNLSTENLKEFVDGIGWVEEEWKPIEEYETYYEISSFGRVRSLDRIRASNDGRMAALKGAFLCQKVAKNTGYLKIVLCKENKPKTYLAHRLVAKAFIEQVPSKPYINHKFGNKTDNRFHKIEWCTQSENVIHGFRVNNRVPTKGKQGKENPKSKPVLVTNRFTGEEHIFESGMMATRALKLSAGSLSRVLTGKYKSIKSYYARFI